jgi:hypothetical protein
MSYCPNVQRNFFVSQILQVFTIEFPPSPPFLMKSFLSFITDIIMSNIWKSNQGGSINFDGPNADQRDREGEL